MIKKLHALGFYCFFLFIFFQAHAQNTIVSTNDMAIENGAIGIKTINVLTNDIVGNTVADKTNVTVSCINTLGVKIDENGIVALTQFLPSGTYSVSYTICEKNKPTNCSSSTLILDILNVIDAISDVFYITSNNTVLINPISNDTLNGVPCIVGTNTGQVTMNATSLPIGFTFDIQSASIVIDQNAPNGTYLLTYEVCENGAIPENCNMATITVTIARTLATENFQTDEKLTIYPNPTTETIEMTGVKKEMNYSILDVLGKEIQNGMLTNEHQKIKVDQLQNGIYLLKTENRTIKFIKQ